jgi:hypothetical protein
MTQRSNWCGARLAYVIEARGTNRKYSTHREVRWKFLGYTDVPASRFSAVAPWRSNEIDTEAQLGATCSCDLE